MTVSSSGVPFGDGGTVHSAPGHEPFEIGSQRPDARLKPIRGHEGGVGAEQGRNLILARLDLVERPFEGGAFVAWIF